MAENWYMHFVAALIPMLVGAVYYHPKVFGTAWMNVNKFTEDSLKEGNPAKIFGFAYLLSVLLTMPVTTFCIHQGGIVASAMSTTDPGTWSPEAITDINAFMAKYGNNFRTFGHGAVHGLLLSVIGALPLFGINSLFERKSAKYNLVHWGYWAITLTLMGGTLCSMLKYAPLS